LLEEDLRERIKGKILRGEYNKGEILERVL
jgi:hypothetical protein